MLQTRLLSSMHRVLPGSCPQTGISRLSAAKNEPLSFQVAFKTDGERETQVYIETECKLPLNTYTVGYVPIVHTDRYGLDTYHAPGLYPDKLLKRQTNPEHIKVMTNGGCYTWEKGAPAPLHALSDMWQSAWFIVNEDRVTVKAGTYEIAVRFFRAADDTLLAQEKLTLEVIDTALLPQKLMYTNWFHCDCLADEYGVEMFGDRFFELFREWVHTAAKNGMNMLLLPAFTPALDTPVGQERRTAQLVKIEKNGDEYSFDFSLMKKYIDIAREAGITHFEHAHLYSQWGAKAAPKIMATVDGTEKRIFGWETDAAGEEYNAFLRVYVKAVAAFLRGEGLEKNTLFHISDEPDKGNEEAYGKAFRAISKELDGFMLGDALSMYWYYENGLVPIPIVKTEEIEKYLGRCDHLWAYYTGGYYIPGGDDLSNRIPMLPGEMNRVIGVEMYANHVEGFLHWGYNYYYHHMGTVISNPDTNPLFYNGAGGAYCVYPGRNGECIQSIAQKVFAEGIDDMRALETLEAKKGRAVCEEILRKYFGEKIDFRVVPKNPESMLALKSEILQALK